MMLVPAAFLVLMIFAALAVDGAGAYLAQRQLTDALAAAANDATTAGLDNVAYYTSGALRLDPATTAAAVCASLAAQGDTDLHDLRVEMGVAGPGIELRGTAEVDAVFGRLIPRFGTRQITAEVRAGAQRGADRAVDAPVALTELTC
jgi:hypothetical protein